MLTLGGLLVALVLWVFGQGLVSLVLTGAGRARTGADLPAAALDPSPSALTGAERLGAGLALGLSLGPALACLAIGLLGPLEPSAGRLLLGGLAALGVAGLWVGRRRALGSQASLVGTPAQISGQSGQSARGWPARLLAVLGLLMAGFALFYGASMPMHVFDPLYHFAYKGSVLYHEGFAEQAFLVVPEDQPEYAEYGRVMTHPNYPPGLPALHVLVAWANGGFDRDATRPLFALFAWLPALMLYGRLRRRGALPAALAAVFWLSLPILYYTRTPLEYIDWQSNLPQGESEAVFVESWTFSLKALWENVVSFYSGAGYLPDGWTLDGAGDLPVGALMCAALCLGTGGPGWRRLLLAGVCLGGAGLAKNEGLPLAGLALLAIGLWQWRVSRPAWRDLFGKALAISLPFLLLMLPWMAVRGAIPSIDEDYPKAVLGMLGLGPPLPGAGTDNLAPVDLAAGLARMPTVALGFATSFVHVLRWNLSWPLCLGAPLWWLLRRPRALWRHPGLPIALWSYACLALYFLILLVTPWDLAVLYTTIIPGRLLLHLAPAMLLLAAELTWPWPAELEPRSADSQ
jgi:hypothetical protein